MGVLHTSVLNICEFFSAKQNISIKAVYLPLSPHKKKVSSPEMPFNERPKCKSLLDYSTCRTAWKNLDLDVADTPCHSIVFPLPCLTTARS